MKSKKRYNPYAFPSEQNLLDEDPNTAGHDFIVRHTGMTLRDYFAAKAMQATDLEQYANAFGLEWAENVAVDSYKLADAMLKSR